MVSVRLPSPVQRNSAAISAVISGIGDGHARKLCLGEGGQARRDRPDPPRSRRQICGSVRAYIRATRSPACRARRRAGTVRLRAGGLDRRHGADEGHGETRARGGERQRRGSVASDHHQVWSVLRNRIAQHSGRRAQRACPRPDRHKERQHRRQDRRSARRGAPSPPRGIPSGRRGRVEDEDGGGVARGHAAPKTRAVARDNGSQPGPGAPIR